MVMNCKFCDKQIDQNNESKWVTVETGKLHYWECESPNAPRLKGLKSSGKKPYTPKSATVDATPQVMEILSAFGKQLVRVEEKLDGIIRSTAFKTATGKEVEVPASEWLKDPPADRKKKVDEFFSKPDEGATLRNPGDVQK